MSTGYFYRFAPLTAHNLFDRNSSNNSECEHGVQWIWDILGDCVQTPQEQASAYLGLLSMAAWLFVVLPQIIKNFRNLEGMAGVSFFLLFQWAGGDVTNLVGAILTRQLKLQIVLAGYFVLTDIVLLGQYMAFLCAMKRRKRAAAKETAADQTPRLILCLMGLALVSCGQVWSPYSPQEIGSLSKTQYLKSARHISRSLLSVTQETRDSLLFQSEQSNNLFVEEGFIVGRNGTKQQMSNESEIKDEGTQFWKKEVNIIGYSIGVLSSVFYIGSRSAQIYKNVRTQSTEGLAIMTFLLAVLGNLSYGAQILVRDRSLEFLLEKTPWLVGSLGVVLLDCTLLFQFRYYSGKHRNRDEMRQSLLNASTTVPINQDDYGTPIHDPEPHNEYIY